MNFYDHYWNLYSTPSSVIKYFIIFLHSGGWQNERSQGNRKMNENFLMIHFQTEANAMYDDFHLTIIILRYTYKINLCNYITHDKSRTKIVHKQTIYVRVLCNIQTTGNFKF